MERAEVSYDFNNLGRDPNTPAEMSGCAKVGVGCGIATLILFVIGGLGIWYAYSTARSWGTDLAASTLKDGIKQLKLPAEQEQQIAARIDNVSQQFKDGHLNLKDMERIFGSIVESPLLSAGMALVVERAYLDKSGLSEEEKSAAKTTIHRFTHGAIQNLIPRQTVDAALDHISTVNNEGAREFRSPVSDDELRAFLKAAQQAADESDVPAEVPEVDFADEFDKAIDRALGLPSTPTELTAEQPDDSSEPPSE